MPNEQKTLKLSYEIQMKTPVGIKSGSLYAEILDNQINGYLDITRQTEPFYGYIDEQGNCKIQGKLKSLLKTYSYKAVGYIDKEIVNLIIYTNSLKFYISGKEGNYEKILQ